MSKLKLILIPGTIILALTGLFLLYTSSYYPADQKAQEALVSDGLVNVSETPYGWFFDGPADDFAMVFYPGAKVEETAYAPLMHLLAADGLDVCLVKMPQRMAWLHPNKAKKVMEMYSYENWYIGGHSLGGAMASKYASRHPEQLKGVILCASYPCAKLDGNLKVMEIYGSQDEVLNRKRLENSRKYLESPAAEYIIEGGNHAQFGSYGIQRGDGEASVSAEQQQQEVCQFINGQLYFT